MQRFHATRLLTLALAFSAGMGAQRPDANESTVVPRLIRFTGVYRSFGQAEPGAAGITFSIYREQYDGTPLWSEIQNVQPDKDGNYSVLLGSTRSEGLPIGLFTTAEPRWLEVEADQMKQKRVLLTSVPYAMKAADVETLGGLPASAYLRAGSPQSISTILTGLTPGTTYKIGACYNTGSPNWNNNDWVFNTAITL